MSTFTPKNERFGRRAHEKAWDRVYLEWLPDDVVVVDLQGTERDYRRDEDREARIFREGLDEPIHVSIQERFRRAKWADERDVTIATHDEQHGNSLHLSDSDADFLVYGYYDDEADRLLETVVVDMGRLKWLLGSGDVSFEVQTHGGGKDFRFVCIPFEDLLAEGAVEYHYLPEPDLSSDDVRRFRDTNYWVTRNGRVWSEKLGGKWLKPCETNAGYYEVQPVLDGKQRKVAIHRMVAECFLERPDGDDISIDHLNGRRRDNRASNLEYVTRGENARRKGKKTLDEVEQIRRRYASGELTTYELADEYNISRSSVGPIIYGESYPDAPGPIKGEDYDIPDGAENRTGLSKQKLNTTSDQVTRRSV